MQWTAYTWHGGTGLVTWSHLYHKWTDVPDNIAFVDVYYADHRRRLQGMDNYWMDVDCFGMFNDEENAGKYEGKQWVAYAIVEGQEYEMTAVPFDIRDIRRGIQMPDDIAKIHGLL